MSSPSGSKRALGNRTCFKDQNSKQSLGFFPFSFFYRTKMFFITMIENKENRKIILPT